MAKGAFDKFVRDFEGKAEDLPMFFQHSELSIVGAWKEFVIDGKGLKGKGEIFAETTKGADVKALIKRGMLGSVSIRFKSKDYEENDAGGFTFKEVDLVEASIVLHPANKEAKITSIKSDRVFDFVMLEKTLRNAGLSRNEAKHIVFASKKELRYDSEFGKCEKKELLKNVNKLLKKGITNVSKK